MSTQVVCPRIRWLLLLSIALLASVMTTARAQPEAETPSEIQLAAVQMTLDLADYWTYEAFEAKIRSQFEAGAATREPGLPALGGFPEGVGLMLAVQGMESRLAGIGSIGEAIGTAGRSPLLALCWTR